METRNLSSRLQKSVKFSLGFRDVQKFRIIPLFFPFLGCEERCIFCAQHRQTGIVQLHDTQASEQTKEILYGIPPRVHDEIAFYGGTFTLWPRATQRACLEAVAERYVGCDRWHVRCSTRPAAFSSGQHNPLEPEWLDELHRLGLDCVELGVQSFDTLALQQARRGYTGEAALQGCATVLAAGMRLGVQLMPGMPGVSPAVFLHDVSLALQAGAQFLRLYPCVVMEGTPLADVWRSGSFTPWGLDVTINTLAQALVMCWNANVPVIRMGLAPGERLADSILAGPWHPALGSLVQAEALGLQVARHLGTGGTVSLALPRRSQGFAGDKRAGLRERWQQLGIPPHRVTWHDGLEGILTSEVEC